MSSEVISLFGGHDTFQPSFVLATGDATGEAICDVLPETESRLPAERRERRVHHGMTSRGRGRGPRGRGRGPSRARPVQSTSERVQSTPEDNGQLVEGLQNLPDDHDRDREMLLKELQRLIDKSEEEHGGNHFSDEHDGPSFMNPDFSPSLPSGGVQSVQHPPRGQRKARGKRTAAEVQNDTAASKYKSEGRKKLSLGMLHYLKPRGGGDDSQLRNNVSQAKGLEQYTFVYASLKERLVAKLGVEEAEAHMPEISAFAKRTKSMAMQTLENVGIAGATEIVEDMLEAAKKAQSNCSKPTRSWGEEANLVGCTAFACIFTPDGEALRGNDNPAAPHVLIQSSHGPCPGYKVGQATQDAAKCHPSCSACFTQFMRDQASCFGEILSGQASTAAEDEDSAEY